MKRDYIYNKIAFSLRELVQKRNIWKFTNQKVIFTNGCFDILHKGHLDYLAKAADMGDKLIIGLNTDSSVKRLKGETRPINNELDRAFQLASLLCVDSVCFFGEDTPIGLIELIRPDVLVKGGDYDVNKLIGGDFIKSYGGEIAIIPFVEGYSTTSIINKIKG